MSLRSKIILLFIGLAVLPLLTLATVSYRQAERLLVTTVQGQLQETANTLSKGIEARLSEIDGALDELAGAGFQGGAVATGDASALLGSGLDQAVFLQVSNPSGPARTLMGSVPGESSRLKARESSGLIEFTRALHGSGPAGALRVGFWASDLIPWTGRGLGNSVVILDAPDGEVLFSDGSPALRAGDDVESSPELSWAVATLGTSSGLFEFPVGDDVRLGAVATVQDEEWVVVVASNSSTALSALDRMFTAYWAFVIGLAVLTALSFSLLLGHFTKALTDLTRAAEQIGTGDLNHWLPLPTSGEIGRLTLAFNRMLERIKEMMNQVDQSGRLAAVGQLSAYFAHEIRNPLSSIKLNLQRLNRWTQLGKLPEFCLEPLEISLREVERLTTSVSEVLNLSRSQESPRDMVSLHVQVEESVDLLMARFMNQGVELTVDLDAESDLVLARPGQIKSVILNLMINALEAQPEGGFLTIRSDLTSSRVFGGPAVTVRFGDGGPGVPKEVQSRVFQPFFTTKAGGSGIGLAVADREVRENGGRLYLESFPRVGSGAEFVMTFPLAAANPVSIPAPESYLRAKGGSPSQDRPDILGGDPEHCGIPEIPTHLMTREGREAVIALSLLDSEEVN